MPLDMSTLMPGMNPSGTNQAVPGVGGGTTPAMGGASNPFLPSFPTGTSMPGTSNPMLGPDANMGQGGAVSMNGQPASATGGSMDPISQFLAQLQGQGFGANGVGPGFAMPGMAPGGSQGGGFGSNFNLGQSLGIGGGPGGNWAPNQHDFIKALHKAGFSAGDAALLYNFLSSGAGFNQGAINNLLSSTFAAQQPQINRGEADILEHFGAMGLGMSSPAAIGLGDYLSQVSLDQGQLAAQVEMAEYNQAVQNYLSVLMGGKGPAPKNFFDNLLSWISASSTAAKNAGQAAAGAG